MQIQLAYTIKLLAYNLFTLICPETLLRDAILTSLSAVALLFLPQTASSTAFCLRTRARFPDTAVKTFWLECHAKLNSGHYCQCDVNARPHALLYATYFMPKNIFHES